MQGDIEIKNRILKISEELFLKYGYSRVTMDEIASNSGISKKTLYVLFQSKEELIREIIIKIQCVAQDYINNIFSNNEMDFAEKLRKFLDITRILYLKVEGPLLEDLHKSIPELWQQINEFENENLKQKFIQIINIGVEKEIFRKDIDQQLIVLIYSSAIKGLINYETLSQIPFSSKQVFESMIKVIFDGILTEGGRIKYNLVTR